MRVPADLCTGVVAVSTLLVGCAAAGESTVVPREATTVTVPPAAPAPTLAPTPTPAAPAAATPPASASPPSPSPSPSVPDDKGPVLREGDVTFVPASDGTATHVWLCRGKDGRVLARVFSFDNGPDPLSEGLRRYIADEKWGFVDARCRVVVPAAWDFVEPFSRGRARACIACTRQQDGEHWRMVGGRWLVIDRSGRER